MAQVATQESSELMYQPRPFDISGEQLPQELRSVIEPLAENAHEVWAEVRSKSSDAAPNPKFMAPFGQLAEAEREIDRSLVRSTLSKLRSMGYQILLGSDAHATLQDAEQQDRLGQLGLAGKPASNATLLAIDKLFHRTDTLSTRLQTLHLRSCWIAGLLGALGIVFAISELAMGCGPSCTDQVHSTWQTWIGWAGVASALVALTTVVWAAWIRRYRDRWLLLRVISEDARAMRCQYLTDSRLWQPNRIIRDQAEQDYEAWLRDAETEVELQRHAKLAERRLHDLAANPAPALQFPTVPGAAFPDRLRSEYVDNRLEEQLEFMNKRSESFGFFDTYSRNIPPFLFYAAIAAALLALPLKHLFHALYVSHSERSPGQIEVLVYVTLVFIAAALPAASAGLRTLRSATELARNKLRYKSTAATLNRCRNRLKSATTTSDLHHAVLEVEHVLANERREWLRLMLEAEWYA
jgi:hypothetical protein